MLQCRHLICRSSFVSVALLFALLLATGCATFNHDWNKAGQHLVSPDSLQGRWEGVWASDVTGHKDQLRCVITKKKDGTFQARFHAKYHTVLSFGYTVALNVQPTAASTFKFSGEANLGWVAGGRYEYEGEADRTNFFSTYRCKYDHGTFQMMRPPE
jgi:hypothetical protein